MIIALVILALLVGFVLYLRSKQPIAAPPRGRNGQNGPVAVSVATAVSGDIEVKIPALGTVTPLATVTVRTQITGTLQKIYFTEGQFVRQGDALAQIDPRPYEAALQQMEGNLKRDQALLADAKLDLKRYEGLVKEDSIAQQQLDTQRALVDQYTGTIQADEGQVKTARSTWCTRTSSHRSRAGSVCVRSTRETMSLRATPMASYCSNQLQPITVIFTIPEDNVPAVMKRLHEGATLTAAAFDKTNVTKLADGKLLTVDNLDRRVDRHHQVAGAVRECRQHPVSRISSSTSNCWWMSCTNQVIMPNAAVRRGAPNGVASTFVYLVNADRTVTVRPVTLGVVDGEKVSVTAGLKPGEIVVTEGGDRLREGSQVLARSTPVGTPAAGTAKPDKPGAPATRGARHGRSRPKPPPSQ